jgi:hypothetical protein
MSPRTVTTTSAFAAPARARLSVREPRLAAPSPLEPRSRAEGSARSSGDPLEPTQRLPVTRPLRGCWASALSLALLTSNACGGGVGARPAGPPSAPSPALASTVSFALPSNEGQLVDVPLARSRGTLVDAFAPSCAPCAEKLPALMKRRADLRAAGVELVLVAVLSGGESDTEAMQALERWGVAQAFLVDRGDVLRRELAVASLPATVLLDTRGVVRWVAPESATPDDVVAAAQSLAER